MVTLKQTETFHKKKDEIQKVILSKMDDHEVIYGARAINKRLPKYLERETTDYDIYSSHNKKDAREVERELDEHFGGDYFEVVEAEHAGTSRVRSKINGEVYVDYTKPEEEVPYDTIGGRKYVKLKRIKEKIKESLKNPDAKYRHDKDRDALNRIRVYEQMRKNRQPRRTQGFIKSRMPKMTSIDTIRIKPAQRSDTNIFGFNKNIFKAGAKRGIKFKNIKYF